MSIPAPFQSAFDYFREFGMRILHADWTTSLKRHFGAKMEDHQGNLYYAKCALAQRPDLDEPNMIEGLRREVWWANTIHALRMHNPLFPFSSPQVVDTNLRSHASSPEVAWVLFEHIEGQPIVDWEPERSTRRINSAEEDRFDQLFDAVIKSLLALEQIHPSTLEALRLPPLPSPPHGMRRWQRKGLLDMRTAVLGNGAFEIKNFWRDTQGRLVILDNEFAGWYPKYDHLSYLYHRLYCNTMRPDLARRMLSRYMDEAMSAGDFDAHPDSLRGFWKSFTRILKPRVLGGWYYDTVRRKLPPWHKKQRLRYGLLWTMFRGYYGRLKGY